MLSTLEKGLIKTGLLTALTLFVSNIVVTLGSLRLGSFLLCISLQLFLPGGICFVMGMRTTRLTGDAGIGWALSCLACLVAGLATSAVLIGDVLVTYSKGEPYAMNGISFLLGCLIVAFFVFAQGLCCGVLAGWIGSKLGERWADEPSSEIRASSSSER